MAPDINQQGFWLLKAIEGMVRWLLTVRVRTELLFREPRYCGRILAITPWRDVLVIRTEYGMYVVSAHHNYLDDWQIQQINSNRYEQ